MRIKNLSYTALAIALAFTVTACSRSRGPDVPIADAKAVARTQSPVVLFDKTLKGKIAADQVEQYRLADGRMSISANLRNRTKKALTVQTRTVFKDAGGFAIDDETSWQNLFLSPQQYSTVRAASMTGAAEMATVEVRYPKSKQGESKD